MNYGEIKHNIISLGFAEESDYLEYEELGYTYDAINRAMDVIRGKFPYISTYEFEIDEDETDFINIDLNTLPGFLQLAKDTPVMFEKDGKDMFQDFGDYKIKSGHRISIDPAGHAGSIRIYYNRECTRVDENTEDTFVPELPLKVHHLIPLLASYYLWLDDDVAKASQYYNMYETEESVVLQDDLKPSMGIVTEWGGI